MQKIEKFLGTKSTAPKKLKRRLLQSPRKKQLLRKRLGDPKVKWADLKVKPEDPRVKSAGQKARSEDLRKQPPRPKHQQKDVVVPSVLHLPQWVVLPLDFAAWQKISVSPVWMRWSKPSSANTRSANWISKKATDA